MGYLARLLSGLTFRSAKDRILARQPYLGIMGGGEAAGVEVNPTSALSVSALFAAIKAIAEDVASLPLVPYRESDKLILRDHPTYSLLRDSPNEEMTAVDARTAIMAAALLFGNGYAEIVRDGRGTPLELWPIEPWRVAVYRGFDNKLTYKVDGVDLPAFNVLHIRDITFNGLVAASKVVLGKEVFGLTIAAQRFAAKFFQNGARTPQFLSTPNKLTPDAKEELRTQYADGFGGVENAYKTPVFDNGLEFKSQATAAPEESQLLETRLFQVQDVARWFRIPPPKLQDLSKGTFANIESLNQHYYTDCLRPWCVRFEQQCEKKLLLPGERSTISFKHKLSDLLRADTKTRAEANQIAIRNGWKNVDEIRDDEDLPPIPDRKGQVYLVSSDLMAVSAIETIPESERDTTPKDTLSDELTPPPADPPAPTGNEEEEEKDERAKAIVGVHRSLLVNEVRRILRVEQDKVLRAIRRGNFAEWASHFYPDHRKVVAASLRPLIRAMTDGVQVVGAGSVDSESVLSNVVGRHVDESRADLADVEGMEQRVEGWEVRAETTADQMIEELLSQVKP